MTPDASGEATVLVAIDDKGVATVTMNRPEVHNAFDDHFIRRLTEVFAGLGADPAVRVVVLAARGKSFSAGGDLNWMRRMADYSPEENYADAMGLAGLYRTLNGLPKPTVAVVHGATFAGGTGLVAASDVAIASDAAVFCISEARLGLIPATIGPYLVAAIGARAARRYFQSAERFSAAEAKAMGLVHEVVPGAELDATRDRIVAALLECGPEAQAGCKRAIAAIAGRPIDDAVVAMTARLIAETRAGDEAREGLAAFFEKRKPRWRR